MSAVRFTDVHKRYDGVVAVSDLSLDIANGEFMVLVGPSGCGKTTALRMVAGLEDITDGLVRIGDRVVNDLTPKRRDIAMVFQSYALYPHLTVYKNIAFPLKAQNVPKHLHKEKVEWASSLLGIGALLQRKPRELSGGERQRVALARALVTRPACVLADEPTGNLDRHTAHDVYELLSRVNRESGTAFVIVTHDQELAARADRVLHMERGKLVSG